MTTTAVNIMEQLDNILATIIDEVLLSPSALWQSCSSGEQESHHLHVALHSGTHQGGPAINSSRLLHVCSCSQQDRFPGAAG